MSIEDTTSEKKAQELFKVIKDLYGITTDTARLFNQIAEYEKKKNDGKTPEKKALLDLTKSVQKLMEIEDDKKERRERQIKEDRNFIVEKHIETMMDEWRKKRDEAEKKGNTNWQKILKATRDLKEEFKESISDAFSTLEDLPIIGDLIGITKKLFGVLGAIWTLFKPFTFMFRMLFNIFKQTKLGQWLSGGLQKIGKTLASPFRIQETREERLKREEEGRETDEEAKKRELEKQFKEYNDTFIQNELDKITRLREEIEAIEEAEEKRNENIEEFRPRRSKSRSEENLFQGEINLADFEANRARLLAEEDGADIASALDELSNQGIFAEDDFVELKQETEEVNNNLTDQTKALLHIDEMLTNTFEGEDKYDKETETETETETTPTEVKEKTKSGGFLASILTSFLPMLLAGGAILGGILWLAKDAIEGYQKGGIFGAIKGALFGQFESGMSGAFKNGGKFALIGGGIGFSVGGPAGALTGALVGFGLGMFANLIAEDIIGGYEQGGVTGAIWRSFVGQTNSGLTGMFKNAGKFAVLGAGIGFTAGGPFGAIVGGLLGFVTGQVFNLVGSIIDAESEGNGLFSHMWNSFKKGMNSDKWNEQQRDKEFAKDLELAKSGGSPDLTKYGGFGAKFVPLTEEQSMQLTKAKYEYAKSNRGTTAQIQSLNFTPVTEQKPVKIEKSEEEKQEEVKFRKEQTDYFSKSKNLSDYFLKGDFWDKFQKFGENFIDEFILRENLNKLNDEIIEDISRGVSAEDIKAKLASRSKAVAFAGEFLKGNKTVVNNVVNNTANNYSQMTQNNYETRKSFNGA